MKKKTVAILAPTGMLGSMVYREFKDSYRLVLIYRDSKKLSTLDNTYGGIHAHKCIKYDLTAIQQDYIDGFTSTYGPQTRKLVAAIGKVDAVINCAGITKPYSLKNPLMTMFINATLPHILSSIYKEKLIQITTDCAYNGTTGAPYDEHSPKTPNDLYGLSKSLGEPTSGSLVLRTSIIGPEIEGHTMLLDWFLNQDGQTISGYTNHLWNGITTKEFARVCDKIISNRSKYPKSGLYHIFSSSVTKFDMLSAFQRKYGTRVTIKPVKATVAVNRRLKTKYPFCAYLKIPTFKKMLADL